MSSLFNQLLGDVFLYVAYILGMFIVLAFRSKEIEYPKLLRRSLLLFAASIIVFPFLNLFIAFVTQGNPPNRIHGNTSMLLLMKFGDLLSRSLFAASFVTALMAFIDRNRI